MILWKLNSKTSDKAVADIGDLHLILKKQQNCWQLYISIRVYTQDKQQNMLRPSVSVAKFKPNCTITEAQILAQNYLYEFLSDIFQSLNK